MNCSRVIDLVYEYSENKHRQELFASDMPILTQLQVWLHTLLCSNCAHEIERYNTAREALRKYFFAPSPGLEDSIMAKLQLEQDALEQDFIEEQTDAESYSPISAGISTRSWIIAGIIVMVSLATVFFGLDFQELASESGTSFLLPIGITIGIAVTIYGAFFIGSHLKEFSERFGL